MFHIASKIYLISFNIEKQKSRERIDIFLEKMYDVKYLFDNLYLVKTTDDIDILEKYLLDFLGSDDLYLINEITDQTFKYKNNKAEDIQFWLFNV